MCNCACRKQPFSRFTPPNPNTEAKITHTHAHTLTHTCTRSHTPAMERTPCVYVLEGMDPIHTTTITLLMHYDFKKSYFIISVDLLGWSYGVLVGGGASWDSRASIAAKQTSEQPPKGTTHKTSTWQTPLFRPTQRAVSGGVSAVKTTVMKSWRNTWISQSKPSSVSPTDPQPTGLMASHSGWVISGKPLINS